MCSRTFFLIISFIQAFTINAQRKVAITIDDVPNTRLYETADYQSELLKKLDSAEIPSTIFINEGLIYKTDSVTKNFALLNEWIMNDHVIVGNHTFSHSRYSDVGLKNFTEDIRKGGIITKELASKYDKQLKYFRFPFNDMGIDSLQHKQIDSTLNHLGYQNTPFTVESSDWMFNAVYKFYLNHGEDEKAKDVGELYVRKTMAYFNFFDSLATVDYNRTIDHIYLCHDNQLNTDYLMPIITRLQNSGYELVTLDEALEDDFYKQTDSYYYKWGVSWYYRYMRNHKERMRIMRAEPDMTHIYELYENIKKDID